MSEERVIKDLEDMVTIKDLKDMVTLIKNIDHLEDVLYERLYEDEEEKKEIEDQVLDLWDKVLKILRKTNKYPYDIISAAVDGVINQYYISKNQ